MEEFVKHIVGRNLADWEKGTLAAAGAGTTLTLDALRQMTARLDDIANETFQRFTPGVLDRLGNIKIYESPLCTRQVPVKTHKKRRNQSPAYHARINKKWRKRFGTKPEQVAYMIDFDNLKTSYGFGPTGKALMVSPGWAPSIRNLGT